jgi:cytochrome c553
VRLIAIVRILSTWSLVLALLPSLALADAAAVKERAQLCATCHGPDGNSVNPLWPTLAGQTARYIYLQLRDFQEGRRKDPLMSPIASTLSREDTQDLAEYFSQQRQLPNKFNADSAKIAQGRKIADDALCPMCHLGGFSGQNEIPRVAGQQYEYIVKQLKDFRDRRRTNDAGNMAAYTRGLTDEQIDALAQYAASLN